MLAKREIWNRTNSSDVWIGKYLNSNNLPHWHSNCELLTLEKGALEVVCENKTYFMEQNDSLFIDSEQIHYMQAKQQDTTLAVIIFDYEIIKKLFDGNVLVKPYLSDKYDAKSLYESLKKELSAKQAFYNESAKIMISKFFIDLLRKEKTEKRKEKTAVGQLRLLLNKIESDFDTITFSDAYRFMAMDEAYFCRYFKKAANMSFTQYLNRIKIDNAIKLLRQEKKTSVTSAAFTSGFGSIRHFNKIFKELTGFSPKQLPRDYVLNECFLRIDSEFNPTLKGCSLLEQF